MQINLKTKETNTKQKVKSNLKDGIKVSKSYFQKTQAPDGFSGKIYHNSKSDNPNLT